MSETTTAPEDTRTANPEAAGGCGTPNCCGGGGHAAPAVESVSAPVATGPSIINVTEGAVGEIKRVMEEQGMSDESVLRVGVAGGGCSGFSYSLGFDDKTDAAKDHVSLQHGLKVAVDKKSALYLDGTTIDFYNGLDKRGFTFDNPNAKNSCGCGSSFSA